jgi:hypothetical protein
MRDALPPAQEAKVKSYEERCLKPGIDMAFVAKMSKTTTAELLAEMDAGKSPHPDQTLSQSKDGGLVST